jgi:hypothetical protein
MNHLPDLLTNGLTTRPAIATPNSRTNAANNNNAGYTSNACRSNTKG